MRDTTAFTSEALGACHLLAFVTDAKTLGARADEYANADPGLHKSDSWHGRRDPFNKHMLAVDVNACEGDERAEQAFFRKTLVPIAKTHGLAICCGIGRYHVANHSIGDGLHLHADVGHYSNLGERPNTRGYLTAWAGRPTAAPWPVRAFQKAQGLTVDGIPGKLTTAALQRAVGATPDSIWGKATTAAIQKKVGAGVDGIPGGETYYKLGLWIEGGCK